jgi:CelD/BcsL family acetyltransferase involved in cellulose biosynthesis
MEIRLIQEFPVDLLDDWNHLLEGSISHFPFLRFEYLHNWWQTKGGGEWHLDAELAILLGYEADVLVGIAPFFIAEHDDSRRMLFLGSIEISDYLDLIVSKKHLTSFAKAILAFVMEKYVKPGKINAVDLYNLVEGTPSIHAISSAGLALGFKIAVEKLQHSPYITLPGDWEQYLASIDSKQRHEIRRKMRRAIESEFPAELYLTTDRDHLEEDMESFLTLMNHDPNKCIFLSEPMRVQMKQTMRCAFEGGCLQLAFLVIGGEKTAAYLNFDYLNRIWVYNSGLDQRFMEFSPGWVLLGHLLKWANENKREEFDFMRGNEDYKYKFGAVDRFVVRQTLKA